MRVRGIFSSAKMSLAKSIQHRKLDNIFIESKERLATLDNSEENNSQDQIDVLIGAVEETNKALEEYNRRFEVSVHEGTNAVMVKVVDVNTDEIIREIPPEKILDMVAALWEIAGIIVDRKI